MNLRALVTFASLVVASVGAAAADRPNILLITVDDMSCDSIGAFGCKLPGTTPNIDRLAAQSLKFEHAHVQVGNCMPSRNVMLRQRPSNEPDRSRAATAAPATAFGSSLPNLAIVSRPSKKSTGMI